MNDTNNSFSTTIEEFARLQVQLLEILKGVSTAVTSSEETVNLTFNSTPTTEVQYQVPSFGYLESSIKRIDNTISKLIGLDSSDANIRQADGTFKTIYQSKLLKSPERITSVPVPNSFNYKNNWIFENFLNPILYIPVDVSAYIKADSTKILTKRIILSSQIQSEIDFFTDRYIGNNDIIYEDLLSDLQDSDIAFFQDESILDLPLSMMRYEGTFDVYKYEDVSIEDPSGTSNVNRRKYFLNKLELSLIHI